MFSSIRTTINHRSILAPEINRLSSIFISYEVIAIRHSLPGRSNGCRGPFYFVTRHLPLKLPAFAGCRRHKLSDVPLLASQAGMDSVHSLHG